MPVKVDDGILNSNNENLNESNVANENILIDTNDNGQDNGPYNGKYVNDDKPENAWGESDNSSKLNGIVTITDPDAPLVVLFGPTSCGKTMTLIRITRYLRKLGYGVEPDRSFRPSSDKDYAEDCKKFNQTINEPLAAAGTSGYMLLNIIQSGRILCKILEAPGEYYFDPSNPQQQYPYYMQTIMMASNKKVWCVFVEPDWEDTKIRTDYVNRISALKPQMAAKDKMIFVFNKIDKTRFVKALGVIDEKLAINEIKNFYPGIFASFRCTLPIIKWFREYDCSFVPFQTGTYTENYNENGEVVTLYAEGPEEYVLRLWNEIRRNI